jgi:hypothetical protein
MVSDEAKEVLVNWKKEKGFTTLDEALQDLLLEFKPMSSIINELDELKAHVAMLEKVEREKQHIDEDVIEAVWPACKSQED